MENSGNLHRRSDGFYETSDGLFAVCMLVKTGQTKNGHVWFEFKTGPQTERIRVEWQQDEKLQLFPSEVAKALLSKGWAASPTEAALKWYEGIPQKTAPKQPKAPAPTPTPRTPEPPVDEAENGVSGAAPAPWAKNPEDQAG